MAFLFIGSEMEDFVPSGGAGYTGGANYRTTYARTAIQCSGAYNTQYVKASFTASSLFAFTAQTYMSTGTIAGNVFLWLGTSGSTRLRLKATTSVPTTITLESYTSGGVAATLATSALTIVQSTNYKIDVLVNYATSGGYVKVYVNGTLYINFSGDPTVSGSTTLNELYLGAFYAGAFATIWSEVIVTDGEDTRPLSVKTLAPNAAGDVTGWTSGAYTDIDEITATDTDLAVSDTAAQVLAVNCTGMPTGGSGLSVRAVKNVALVARGATGPSKIDIGLRQSSTNAFASSQTLDTGYATYSATWTTNPITGAAFTGTEIDGLQLAYRSAT